MTAAENKIILDKGSDYRLQLKVKDDDGINDRDLTGWGWKFQMLNTDGTSYALVEDVFTGTYSGDNLAAGSGTIAIDSTVTAPLLTGNSAETVFDTEYNYFYTLTLYEDGVNKDNDVATREMRVMRGKLSIRV